MLPPVIHKSDTIPLISPRDTAIDQEQLPESPEPPKDAPEDWEPEPTWWERYCRAERDHLDIERLPLVDGAKPTVFHVRGLTQRERDLALSLSMSDLSEEDGPDKEARMLASTAYLSYCVRLGLARVESPPDGWDFHRSRRYGVRMWTEEMLDALDATTFTLLGLAIANLSSVPLASSGTSG